MRRRKTGDRRPNVHGAVLIPTGEPKGRPSEAGQSLLWTTIVFMFVLVPLLVLVVDGIQFWRIRNQLQTATDAACEEAAYVGADRRAYRDSGVVRFGNTGQAKADATKTFFATLHNTDAFQYSPAIQIGFDGGVPSSICNATASVQPLISALAPSAIHLSRDTLPLEMADSGNAIAGHNGVV